MGATLVALKEPRLVAMWAVVMVETKVLTKVEWTEPSLVAY